jgi:hypothetical protein
MRLCLSETLIASLYGFIPKPVKDMKITLVKFIKVGIFCLPLNHIWRRYHLEKIGGFGIWLNHLLSLFYTGSMPRLINVTNR